MAVQLRDYRIREGELGRFVAEWRAHLAPLRMDMGFTIPGAWTVPAENRFIWLLAHAGDWSAFEAADAEYYASPRRTAIVPDPARLIEEQQTSRLDDVPLP
jgi:NIPSNAP